MADGVARGAIPLLDCPHVHALTPAESKTTVESRVREELIETLLKAMAPEASGTGAATLDGLCSASYSNPTNRP